MEVVLITGGTGLIGTALTKVLKEKGYEIRILSRSMHKDKNATYYQWDIANDYIEEGALNGVHHIFHLSGANVGEKNWSAKRKKALSDSRIKAADLLFKHHDSASLKTFIAASGSSYYGTITTEQIFSEEDAPQNDDFLCKLTQEWEKATFQFDQDKIRVACLRTGVVLSAEGGALDRITKPVRMGFGAALGSGKQYMPWIHLNDIVKMYVFVLENEGVKGPINAVAPAHINNKELTKAIGKCYNKKVWLPPVPGFLLKLFFGEMAGIILKGSRLSAQKITAHGFEFEHVQIDSALNAALNTP